MKVVFMKLMQLLPGLALSCVIAMAATLMSMLYDGLLLLFALFFGVAVHYLSREASSLPGIEFSARTLLRLGVGLLGARITTSQIAGLGWSTAAIVVGAVVSTLFCGVLIGRRLGVNPAHSVLSGGAVAICGASAALAIASVLPRNKESESFTLMVVMTVTLLSTLAMIIYPLVATSLQLPADLAGLFLGGTIHDVAQVVGAGYMLDQATGDYATIVKLFRVSMLAVVVLVVSILFQYQREASESTSGNHKQPLVPWFLWVFIALVCINSMGGVPSVIQIGLDTVSRACLVIAIAALGVKTSFIQLAKTGWRPFALILMETLWMAGFVLTAIFLRH